VALNILVIKKNYRRVTNAIEVTAWNSGKPSSVHLECINVDLNVILCDAMNRPPDGSLSAATTLQLSPLSVCFTHRISRKRETLGAALCAADRVSSYYVLGGSHCFRI
jgi:hypothetical protein